MIQPHHLSTHEWNFVLTRGSVWFKMVASGTEWGLDEHPVLTLFSKK